MFNGIILTTRFICRNLDPFDSHNDADIWKALEDVELKHIAAGPLGLKSPVLSNGANFSAGEVGDDSITVIFRLISIIIQFIETTSMSSSGHPSKM